MTPPTGYVDVRTGSARGFVWVGARAWAERALEEHGTLEAWAASLAAPRALAGRGTVRAVDAPASGPDGHPEWVVRHYLRGGAVAALTRDRYPRLGRPRPFRELQASVEARARGLPTPAVVAGAVYPAGPLRYTADLVTERVPGALDLAAVLFGTSTGPAADAGADRALDRLGALRTSGTLVALAAEAGVRHPDLNAKNIVIRRGVDGAAEAHMVDLDRCRVRRAPRREVDARAMGARLERSLAKLGAAAGRPLGPDDWAALRGGWAGLVHGRGAREGTP